MLVVVCNTEAWQRFKSLGLGSISSLPPAKLPSSNLQKTVNPFIFPSSLAVAQSLSNPDIEFRIRDSILVLSQIKGFQHLLRC